MRGWALPPPTIILPFTVSMPTSSFLLPTQDSTAHHPCQELPDAVTHRSPGLWANPFRPSCQLYPLLPPLHTHLELPAALEGALAQHFPNLPTPMVRESWESGSVSRWCGLGHHGGGVGGGGRDSPGQAAYVSRNPEPQRDSSFSNVSPRAQEYLHELCLRPSHPSTLLYAALEGTVQT